MLTERRINLVSEKDVEHIAECFGINLVQVPSLLEKYRDIENKEEYFSCKYPCRSCKEDFCERSNSSFVIDSCSMFGYSKPRRIYRSSVCSQLIEFDFFRKLWIMECKDKSDLGSEIEELMNM